MSGWFRIRSLAWFIIAAVYYIVARGIASVAAHGLSSGVWFDFAERIILLFLLIVGFASMGYVGQRQQHPVKAMGLDAQPTRWREFGLGTAIGWTGMAICALLIALFGGLVVFFYTGWRQFALIPLDLAILWIASLAEEVAFRGYPFQRFMEATNPFFATLFLSVLFALIHIGNPGASPASFLVTMFAGWLLSIAYLRTRALWLGWGIHFSWNATMAVLFGLPLSGLTRFSPVINSTSLGPTWLTGLDYGPEGSALGMGVVLALIVLTLYATRGMSWQQHAQPVGVPAGSPEDIAAAAPPHREPIIVPPPAPPRSGPIIVPAPAPSGSGPIIVPAPAPTPPDETQAEPTREEQPQPEDQRSSGNGE